jgi:hypothetical protein
MMNRGELVVSISFADFKLEWQVGSSGNGRRADDEQREQGIRRP